MTAALSIVVPVFNEGAGIQRTLLEIERHVNTPHEIIVVFDFVEDNTVPAVREACGVPSPIRLVKNHHGRGALAAIKTGFDVAATSTVLVVMADLSDDLSVADEMFARIQAGDHVVCGSRYMKGGRQIGGPQFKKLLSRTAGLSLYYLTGLPTHDVTNSFKMYAKQLLEAITIESRGGFELGMEIVVKAYLGGYRVSEVPSVWRHRATGQSRFRLWHWLPSYLRWYVLALLGVVSRGRPASTRATIG